MKLSTLRRLVTFVGLVAILTIVILLVHAGWRWIEVHTGTINEGGPYYGFWSGFGSDIGEVTLISAVLVGVYGAYRKANCHDPECWRIGKHPTEDHTFVFCHHHHPDLMHAAGRKMTLAEMHEHHHAARARKAGTILTGVSPEAVDEVLAEEAAVAAGTSGQLMKCGDCGARSNSVPCPFCGGSNLTIAEVTEAVDAARAEGKATATVTKKPPVAKKATKATPKATKKATATTRKGTTKR